jgi:hypothetical protein
MLDMEPNRIAERIARYRDNLSRRVRMDNGQPLPANLDLTAFERTLDNTPFEHVAYQNAQARAHATGTLTTAEAQTVYIALGEAPSASGWAAGTDLATKLVVTELMAELVGRSVALRRRRGR